MASTSARVWSLLVHVGNERPIDLDLVEGEAAQVAERAIAPAEIVHDDAHAELAQLMQRGQRILAVLQQHRFGDLQLETMRGQAGRRQRLQHNLDQVALDLQRRQVDRHLDRRGPARRLRASPAQGPLAQLQDQSCLLGQGDEVGRLYRAALGVRPAHQTFKARHLARLEAHERLIEEGEFFPFERLAQIGLELPAHLDVGIHLGLEEGVAVPAIGLRPVEGKIRILDELVRIGAIARRQRQADAGGDVEAVPVDLVGPCRRSRRCGRRAPRYCRCRARWPG